MKKQLAIAISLAEASKGSKERGGVREKEE
jgi:hypothetical protein